MRGSEYSSLLHSGSAYSTITGPRRAAASFITRRNRIPAATSPNATGRSISNGVSAAGRRVAGAAVDGTRSTAFCSSADIPASASRRGEAAPALSEATAIAAIAGAGSGHAVAGPDLCGLDGNALACGARAAETGGAVLASGALVRAGSAVGALSVGAFSGLTERILRRGAGATSSLGVASLGAPACATAAGDAASGAGVDCAADAASGRTR